MENVPINFYDHIMLGGPKRDEQIDNMITTIRNMAQAGIPVFGYHWMPSSVWRTTPKPVRGGAIATAFNYDEVKDLPFTHEREYTEEELWANLEYWLKIIIPVAEEAGIRLGIHPDDPPVKQIGGIPRLFSSYENYRRYLDIYESPNNAIEFCQGTISEMTDSSDDNIYGFIDEMVRRDKVLYVHFRNVSAPDPNDFREEFINTGHVDMYRAMKTYYDAGYEGLFLDDHVPRTQGGHRRATPVPVIRLRLYPGHDRGDRETGRCEQLTAVGLGSVDVDEYAVVQVDREADGAVVVWYGDGLWLGRRVQ